MESYMTIEEKLVNFEESAISAATAKRTELIDEYDKVIKADFEKQKSKLDEKAELKIKIQTEELKRKSNQMLSNEMLNAKRLTGEKAMELTDALFDDVVKKLEEFKKTSDYEQLLIDQILYAVEFAENMPMTVYIDKSDEGLLGKVMRLTNQEITISETPILGGTRTVIHDKNILIDNSFITRIGEIKEDFVI